MVDALELAWHAVARSLPDVQTGTRRVEVHTVDAFDARHMENPRRAHVEVRSTIGYRPPTIGHSRSGLESIDLLIVGPQRRKGWAGLAGQARAALNLGSTTSRRRVMCTTSRVWTTGTTSTRSIVCSLTRSLGTRPATRTSRCSCCAPSTGRGTGAPRGSSSTSSPRAPSSGHPVLRRLHTPMARASRGPGGRAVLRAPSTMASSACGASGGSGGRRRALAADPPVERTVRRFVPTPRKNLDLSS